MCLRAPAKVLVYEPFAYPDGWLTGRGGARGTVGTWTVYDTFSQDWRVHQEGDTSGIVVDPGPPVQRNTYDGTVANLPTSGGYVGLPGPEDVGEPDMDRDFEIGRYMDGSIQLDPSVTAAFTSGTTTWFSYVAVRAWDRNMEVAQLQIATDPSPNESRPGLYKLSNAGNGIGAGGGPPRNDRFDIMPRYHSGGDNYSLMGAATGWQEDAFTAPDEMGTMPWAASDDDGFGAANIIVGKIEWDADTGGEDIITVVCFLETDELSETAFNALVALKPGLSSANWTANKPNLDQSQFDTLNFAGTKFFIDEIRIATTFEDVVGGSPSKARDPQPETDEVDVFRDLVLGWTPGIYADTHDVYLGTAFADVDDASRADPRDVLASQGQTTAEFHPVGLEYGQTYYWRIDEVNGPPDNTIFKGVTWSFTTERYAYPITNVTATASGEQDTSPAVRTVDGSGLDELDQHGTEMADMWIAPDGLPAWIQYTFDKEQKLHELWVWNANSQLETYMGFGAKDVTIEYSYDGETWAQLDGVPQFNQGTGQVTYMANTTVDMAGVVARHVRLTINDNWGAAPMTSLSEVRFFSIPVFAREPSPVPGETDVDVDATLSWRAGREADEHTVYLSTEQQAAIDGSTLATKVTATKYLPSLDLASTYYWRVDEVNEAMTPAVWPGEVWSFSTQEYITIDDFESYTDKMDAGEAIFQTWADGYEMDSNGSVVGKETAESGTFGERGTVHSGRQSMPMTYDNTSATYSEATRTFDSPQDWSQHGIKRLRLWFHGNPDNVLQQMYVKINATKIPCSGDLKLDQWQICDIDLTLLSVSNVTTLGIGFNRVGAVGGQGRVFIDDIRLY